MLFAEISQPTYRPQGLLRNDLVHDFNYSLHTPGREDDKSSRIHEFHAEVAHFGPLSAAAAMLRATLLGCPVL